jgi:hypothetical protein
MTRKFVTIAVLAMLGVTGCSDGVGPDMSHIGTFELSTINGGNLPGTVRDIGGEKVEITAGTMTLNRDNTFFNELVFRTSEGEEVTIERESINGTYTRAGSSIELETVDGFTFVLTLSGNTVRQTIQTFVLAYVK